jgi:thiol-disulfide isomerase/thioredoxin
MKNMKNTLTAILLCITTLTLAQEEVTVTIAGKITNPNSDSAYIMDGWGEIYQIIELDEAHSFKSTFSIEKGYYRFNDGNEATGIFLNDGYDLYLTLDTDSFDETVSHTGNGADANNYLAKKALVEESWGRLNYYGYYCKLKEEKFLSLADSMYKVSLQLLNKNSIADVQFLKLEKQSIEGDKIYKLKTYPNTYRYFTKDEDYKTSNNYPDPFEAFPLSDASLIPAPRYLSSIIDYIYYTRDTAEYRKTGDYSLFVLQNIDNKVQNTEVKMHAMNYFSKSRLTQSKKMDECFKLYKSTETDPDRLAFIEAKYIARKKTQDGAVSPPFSYEAISGKMVSHEDLKGKYVYIDLWATWCGPCLREIPYFDTLQTVFEGQNITFVSICQNDTKERWKATVAKKELKGVQLFAEDDDGQFYEDYQVTGIPRYILIDPLGKIVDSDAKRPSNKQLVTELEALLK